MVVYMDPLGYKELRGHNGTKWTPGPFLSEALPSVIPHTHMSRALNL